MNRTYRYQAGIKLDANDASVKSRLLKLRRMHLPRVFFKAKKIQRGLKRH